MVSYWEVVPPDPINRHEPVLVRIESHADLGAECPRPPAGPRIRRRRYNGRCNSRNSGYSGTRRRCQSLGGNKLPKLPRLLTCNAVKCHKMADRAITRGMLSRPRPHRPLVSDSGRSCWYQCLPGIYLCVRGSLAMALPSTSPRVSEEATRFYLPTEQQVTPNGTGPYLPT